VAAVHRHESPSQPVSPGLGLFDRYHGTSGGPTDHRCACLHECGGRSHDGYEAMSIVASATTRTAPRRVRLIWGHINRDPGEVAIDMGPYQSWPRRPHERVPRGV